MIYCNKILLKVCSIKNIPRAGYSFFFEGKPVQLLILDPYKIATLWHFLLIHFFTWAKNSSNGVKSGLYGDKKITGIAPVAWIASIAAVEWWMAALSIRDTKTNMWTLVKKKKERVDFEKIILITNQVSISEKQSTPRNVPFSLSSSPKKILGLVN